MPEPPPCHASPPQLRLAALNVPLAGDMSGIRGADLQCYRQSQEARLYGTFRAFLSAPTQDLVSIVKRTDRTLPVVNLKAGSPVPYGGCQRQSPAAPSELWQGGALPGPTLGLPNPSRTQLLSFGELGGTQSKLLPTCGRDKGHHPGPHLSAAACARRASCWPSPGAPSLRAKPVPPHEVPSTPSMGATS